MAKTKAEKAAIAEERRRLNMSVLDLAREGGMVGNRPGGVTVGKPEKEDK